MKQYTIRSFLSRLHFIRKRLRLEIFVASIAKSSSSLLFYSDNIIRNGGAETFHVKHIWGPGLRPARTIATLNQVSKFFS